jgi:cyclic-di-GMP-binding biofilm dispersal mediator protein
MSTLASKSVLVIGASGGLGSQFVTQLSAAGATPIVASSQNVNLDDSNSVAAFAEAILSSDLAIDGIVLASGLVAFGSIAETPAKVTEKLMRVNFLSQAQLVAALLPALEKSAAAGNEPFVISISGVIAENPMAGMAAYSASKTALHGWAAAASRELRRAGIRLIDARPGHTETGLATRAIFGQAPTFGVGLEPEKVVARIIDAIQNEEKDLPSTAFTA